MNDKERIEEYLSDDEDGKVKVIKLERMTPGLDDARYYQVQYSYDDGEIYSTEIAVSDDSCIVLPT